MVRNTRKPITRLGQHFLTRPEIAAWVAEAVPLTQNDTVIEIGPGKGILTRELLARARKVVAIEKDPALVRELGGIFSKEIKRGTLVLLEQDVRTFDPYNLQPTTYNLVANIPYYLTGYLIRKFLTASHQPRAVSLLIQKEVAERIVARNGKESLLSLSVKVYGTPSIAHIVKAGAFSPPPKVDSAILTIRDISRGHFTGPAHETRFFEVLHRAFAGKRKTLGATLKGTVTDERFTQCAIPKTARPEDVRLEQWLALTHLPH